MYIFVHSSTHMESDQVKRKKRTERMRSPRLSSPLRSAGPPARMKETKIPSPSSPPTMLKPSPVEPLCKSTFRGSLPNRATTSGRGAGLRAQESREEGGQSGGETGETERQTGRRRDIEKQVRRGDTTNKRGGGWTNNGAFNLFCFIYCVCAFGIQASKLCSMHEARRHLVAGFNS